MKKGFLRSNTLGPTESLFYVSGYLVQSYKIPITYFVSTSNKFSACSNSNLSTKSTILGKPKYIAYAHVIYNMAVSVKL
jgi:hypothetical protein